MVLTPTPRKEGEAQTGTKVEVEEREGAKASLGLKTATTPQHKMLILNKTMCHTPPTHSHFIPCLLCHTPKLFKIHHLPCKTPREAKEKANTVRVIWLGEGVANKLEPHPPPKDLQPITWAVGTPLGLEIVGFVITHKGHKPMTIALAPIIPEMRDKAK